MYEDCFDILSRQRMDRVEAWKGVTQAQLLSIGLPLGHTNILVSNSPAQPEPGMLFAFRPFFSTPFFGSIMVALSYVSAF